MTPGTPALSGNRPVSSAARVGDKPCYWARIPVNSILSTEMPSIFGVSTSVTL
jgi:hypothetical protein